MTWPRTMSRIMETEVVTPTTEARALAVSAPTPIVAETPASGFVTSGMVAGWVPDGTEDIPNLVAAGAPLALLDPLSQGSMTVQVGDVHYIGLGLDAALDTDAAEVAGTPKQSAEAVVGVLGDFSIHLLARISMRGTLVEGLARMLFDIARSPNTNFPIYEFMVQQGDPDPEMWLAYALQTAFRSETEVDLNWRHVGASMSKPETEEEYPMAPLDLSQPRDYAIVVEGTTHRIYMDGALMVEFTDRPVRAIGDASDRLVLGGGTWSSGNGGKSSGLRFGPVLVYNRALTAGELATNRAEFATLGYTA